MTRRVSGKPAAKHQTEKPKVILRVQKKPLPRGIKIFLLSLSFGFIVLFLLWQIKPGMAPRREGTRSSSAEEKNIEISSDQPELKEVSIRIRSGETITDLLLPFFGSVDSVYKLLEATAATYDLTKVRAGNSLVVKTSDGLFHSLTYEIDPTNYLQVQKRDGGFVASVETIPYETRIAYLAGEIRDSLIAAFNQLGEGDALALEVAEIFSWEIDFYLDLRPGDSFSLVYEKKFWRGKFAGYGRVLAAQVNIQGKKYQAFCFVFPDTGRVDYFDAEGNSLRKEFLRSPLKYGRITSRFSYRRLHPIRKVYRPHYGVDYAAPVGTPVQATADGVVRSAGWNGASGRMIHLRHPKGYETMYLHLSRLAPGIRLGVKVTAGEVIGYVGSSGESTGPHLDYRILYRGRYINPLAWRFEPASPLPEKYKPRFQAEIEAFQLLLASPVFFARRLIF